MKKYFVSKTKSIGQAYSVLNHLSIQGWELFEISPVGGGGHLVLFGEKDAVEVHTDIVKSCEAFNYITISDEVIETYLSLREAPLKDVLVIIEHEFIGEIFKVAEDLFQKGFDLLDLRFAKGFRQKAHAFLSYNKGLLGIQKQDLETLESKGFTVTHIEKISAELRNLFESVQPVSDNSLPKN